MQVDGNWQMQDEPGNSPGNSPPRYHQVPDTYDAPQGNIPFLRGIEDDLRGMYRDEFIPERNTTAYVSGLNWRLRESDFLAYFLRFGSHQFNWGNQGCIAICVRHNMRFDGELEGSMYMRFLNRMYFEAFEEESHGFRMAGMVVEVKLAESELPIVPRPQRRNEVGHPR